MKFLKANILSLKRNENQLKKVLKLAKMMGYEVEEALEIEKPEGEKRTYHYLTVEMKNNDHKFIFKANNDWGHISGRMTFGHAMKNTKDQKWNSPIQMFANYTVNNCRKANIKDEMVLKLIEDLLWEIELEKK